jgi:hypothetical protein
MQETDTTWHYLHDIFVMPIGIMWSFFVTALSLDGAVYVFSRVLLLQLTCKE